MKALFDYLPLALLLIALLILVGSTFFTIEQQEVGIIQRFGRFVRLASAGLNVKIPLIEQLVDEVSLRIDETKIQVETKTSDDVFVRLTLNVQYCVMPDWVQDAYYKLEDPEAQMSSYVYDVVRAKVPKMKLDAVFDEKDSVANELKEQLDGKMEQFGYSIVAALVTDVEPDERVKTAMNHINAAQRERQAASEQGEAERILLIKRAEGEAESKRLQGVGIANQRKAIVGGLKDSVEDLQKALGTNDSSEAMALVLATQYFDTLKEIGGHAQASTVFLPHSPGGLTDIAAQIRNGILQAAPVTAASNLR